MSQKTLTLLVCVAFFVPPGAVFAQATKPPRTVVDFYLLLPQHPYFETDAPQDRINLCRRQGGVIDPGNSYLHAVGDGAQMSLSVCLFKRPDKTYLVAVNSNDASDGDFKPFLDFYEYRNGRLHAVSKLAVLPIALSDGLKYELPRYGTTIKVMTRAGKEVHDLVWSRGKFKVSRPPSSRSKASQSGVAPDYGRTAKPGKNAVHQRRHRETSASAFRPGMKAREWTIRKRSGLL